MFGKKAKHVVAEDGERLWSQAREAHERGDSKKAFELYRRAATAGSLRALNSVGVCYMTGFGLRGTPDAAKAVSFFRLGAERGETSAMVTLANALAMGDGFEKKNEKTAFEWYAKAAEAGDEDGLFAMGVALVEGRGTCKNRARARSIFASLIEGGQKDAYLKAYNYLGVCYAEGVEGAKDQTKAMRFLSWLRTRAIRGPCTTWRWCISADLGWKLMRTKVFSCT